MASSYTPSIFCFQRNSMVEKQKGESERDPDGMRACLAVTTSSASESRAPPPPHPPRSPRPAASRAPRRPPPSAMAPSRGHGPGHRAGIRGGWAAPALPSPAPGPREARRGRGKRSASSRTRTLGSVSPSGEVAAPASPRQEEPRNTAPSFPGVSAGAAAEDAIHIKRLRTRPFSSHAGTFHTIPPFQRVHFDTGQKVMGEVPQNSYTPGPTFKSICVQHGVMMRSAHPALK